MMWNPAHKEVHSGSTMCSMLGPLRPAFRMLLVLLIISPLQLNCSTPEEAPNPQHRSPSPPKTLSPSKGPQGYPLLPLRKGDPNNPDYEGKTWAPRSYWYKTDRTLRHIPGVYSVHPDELHEFGYEESARRAEARAMGIEVPNNYTAKGPMSYKNALLFKRGPTCAALQTWRRWRHWAFRQEDQIEDVLESIRVCFVCSTNTGISKVAEGLMRDEAHRLGLKLSVESRGLGGGFEDWYKPEGWSYHEGDDPEPALVKACKAEGIDLSAVPKARTLQSHDLFHFDKILVMDAESKDTILQAAAFWGPAAKQKAEEKTQLFECALVLKRGLDSEQALEVCRTLRSKLPEFLQSLD